MIKLFLPTIIHIAPTLPIAQKTFNPGRKEGFIQYLLKVPISGYWQ